MFRSQSSVLISKCNFTLRRVKSIIFLLNYSPLLHNTHKPSHTATPHTDSQEFPQHMVPTSQYFFSLPMSPPCQECLSSHDLVILACLIICFVVSRHVSVVRSCPLSLVQWFTMNMVKISPSGQQCHHQYELETKHNAIVAFIYLKPTLI